jgi:hypothetical protein
MWMMVSARTAEETESEEKKPARKDRRHLRLVSTQAVSIYRPEGLPREEALPRVRRDMLPERMRYADTGCELARSCLRCPLPRCQYDEPGSVRGWLNLARDREIALLRRRYHIPIDVLAQVYGVGRRRISNILRRQGASRGWQRRSDTNGGTSAMER